MGYTVSINEEADELLKRLKSDPGGVFPRPYKGYLLFLAGAADQLALEWLTKNLVTLDSLTGGHLAFAIFAKRFSFKVNATDPAQDGGAEHRPPPGHEISASELAKGSYSVERIVKSGRLGWVADGDEVIAVTYATDEIAIGLGLLDQLPCVVALDCIPLKSHFVVQLTEEVRRDFISLLRSTITDFSEKAGFDELDKRANSVLETFHALEELDLREEKLTSRLEGNERSLYVHLGYSDPNIELEFLAARISNAKEALLDGAIKRFRKALTGASEKGHPINSETFPGIEASTLATLLARSDEKANIFIDLKRTIESLRYYRDSLDWPLSDEWSARYSQICEKYVFRLLRDESLFDPTLVSSCGTIIQRLEERQSSEVEEIIKSIPSPVELREFELASRRYRNAEAIALCTTEIERLKDELFKLPKVLSRDRQQLEDMFERQVRDYVSSGLPSFSSSLERELVARRLGKFGKVVGRTAGTFMRDLFKPEMLVKIAKFALAGG